MLFIASIQAIYNLISKTNFVCAVLCIERYKSLWIVAMYAVVGVIKALITFRLNSNCTGLIVINFNLLPPLFLVMLNMMIHSE